MTTKVVLSLPTPRTLGAAGYGNYRDYRGYMGLYRGHLGIMEKKMETTGIIERQTHTFQPRAPFSRRSQARECSRE